jgi:hypothetical protein
VIKKRIESLIEREFLERDRGDRKLYRYLAWWHTWGEIWVDLTSIGSAICFGWWHCL